MGNDVIVPVEKKPSGYNPQMTADTRRNTTSDIVRSHRAMLQRAEKVHLSDITQVKERALSYMEQCENSGLLPSMEGFSAFCQLNRQWIYEFLRTHPNSESAEYLKSLQTAWTACRINAAERGCTGETLTIFLLKNSGQGFTDRLEISPGIDNDPLKNLDAEQARKRIMDTIPMEDD